MDGERNWNETEIMRKVSKKTKKVTELSGYSCIAQLASWVCLVGNKTLWTTLLWKSADQMYYCYRRKTGTRDEISLCNWKCSRILYRNLAQRNSQSRGNWGVYHTSDAGSMLSPRPFWKRKGRNLDVNLWKTEFFLRDNLWNSANVRFKVANFLQKMIISVSLEYVSWTLIFELLSFAVL